MTKRHPEETRRALVDAAFWEIYEQGYQAASLDAIIRRVEVTKGALYYYFTNKKELAFAVLDEVIYPFFAENWFAPLRESSDPLSTLQELFTQFPRKAPREALRLGCPLNNLAQEMSPIDEDFRRRIEGIFNEWHEAIRSALARFQSEGRVAGGVDIDRIVTFVVASFEGAASLAKNAQNPSLFDDCMKTIAEYLETLRPEPVRRATA